MTRALRQKAVASPVVPHCISARLVLSARSSAGGPSALHRFGGTPNRRVLDCRPGGGVVRPDPGHVARPGAADRHAAPRYMKLTNAYVADFLGISNLMPAGPTAAMGTPCRRQRALD